MKNNPAKNKLLVILSFFSAVSILFSPIIFASTTTYAKDSGIFPGDLNDDGAVNVLDLILLKLIFLGKIEPMKSPSLDENSDVDQNGIVNFMDNDALLDLIFGAINKHGGGGGGGGGGGYVPVVTPTPTPTTPPLTWYQDADGDGYGNPFISIQPTTKLYGNPFVSPHSATKFVLIHSAAKFISTQPAMKFSSTGNVPNGYVLDNTDCDDTNPAINPGAVEVCDGFDNNCNGQIDEGYPDTDGDLQANCVDSDDDGDGVDDGPDCAPLDGTVWQSLMGYVDADGDGYGTGTGQNICSGDKLPDGYVSIGGDCDDSNPNVWQTLTGYVDNDRDGYGTDPALEVCSGTSLPAGYAPIGGDCDDNDSQVNPGVTEVPYNGEDDDCKTSTLDDDLDQDGHNKASDCDDSNPNVWQTLTGYVDSDHDGYGTDSAQQVCSGDKLPDGYANVSGDCDDTNAAVYPGAEEIVNGLDDNCDGKVDIIDSAIHHLGDDNFTGSVNSQFQMITEGTTYNKSFTADRLQLFSKATLTITHRGVQRADPIKINGQQISSGWNSPSDGSLGTSNISFDISILTAGSNTITITASYESSNHDYDDFEFTDIYITLSP